MCRRLVLAVVLSGLACASTSGEKKTSTAAPSEQPATATPKGVLKPDTVREIQAALRKKGYQVPENGVLEGPTEDKLEEFQKSKHLPDTGLPDRETLRQLGLDPDRIYKPNPKQNA